MTITETDAFEAMLTHYRTLDDRLQALAAAVGRTVTDDTAYAPEVAKLVAYFGDEVLPLALVEHSIYQVAGARVDLAGAVIEMITEHRSLAIEGLVGSPSDPAASEQTDRVAALFTAHVAKENEILLPRLPEDDDVHLAELLMEMQRLTKVARHERSSANDLSNPDLKSIPSHVGLEKVTK